MSSSPSGLQSTFAPLSATDDVEALWRNLAARSEHSFFQSWHWIGTLLATLDLEPWLLRISDGDRLVGLGIVFADVAGGTGSSPRMLSLNATGDSRFDCLHCEYNGVLTDRAYGDAVVAQALATLTGDGPDAARGRYDILHLDGVSPDVHDLARQGAWDVRLRDRKSYFRVDLDALRRTGTPYLQSLSRNTRQQLNRARRHVERHGPLRLSVAADLDDAKRFFGALREYHQAVWERRGLPGAFAEPFFGLFHEQLIERAFDSGVIELAKVSAGDVTLGYLYNFVYQGHVYYYQSGFRYEDDAKDKPGLVSHYVCVQHHLQLDHSQYDFMAGDQRYKMSLGRRAGELVWLVLERPLLKYRLTNVLRAAKQTLMRG